LFQELYGWERPVRGVGVTVCDFTMGTEQLCITENQVKEEKQDRLDLVVDGIRKKYGNKSLQRARILKDKKWSGVDVKEEHVIHPKSFSNGSTDGK
jgi:DNA polymerase-4